MENQSSDELRRRADIARQNSIVSSVLANKAAKKAQERINSITTDNQFSVPMSSLLLFDHLKRVQESHEMNVNERIREILESKGYKFETEDDFIFFIRFHIDSYFIVDSSPTRDTRSVYTIKGHNRPFLWVETLMRSEVQGDTLECVMIYNFYTDYPGW